MDRARCRGTSLFHVQLLLGCTALNVKRLATRGAAASGQAAGPATVQAHAEEAAAGTFGADQAARTDPADVLIDWPSIVPATPVTWTITLSMN